MPSRPAVRDELADLSPERFAALVEAVWTARGRTVHREGAKLTVTKDDDQVVRIYARAAGDEAPVPTDVDLVVSATRAETEIAANWIGPRELEELLWFAVPDTERDRLAAEYFDVDPRALDDDVCVESDEAEAARAEPRAAPSDPVEPTEPSPARGSAADTESGAVDGAPSRPTRRMALVAGGAFVAGLATAAVGGLGPFGSAGGARSEPPATPTPQTEPAVAVPGLSPSGVADPQVLARAHLDRLEASSFTLSSTRTVHADDGTLLSSLRLTARVDESRQFIADIGTAGSGGRDVFGEPPVRATLYSDGDRQYRRLSSDGETSYNAVPLGAGVNGWFYWTNVFPFGGLFYASDEYYRDLLASVPVSLTSRAGDGEPPYHLHATAVTVEEPNPQVFASVDDDSPVENLSLLASVTGAGLVESLRLSFDGERFSNAATALVSTDYRDLGRTSVDRPEWADRAESS